MRRYIMLVPLLLFLTTASWAQDLWVHGFVTAVDSPSSFEIDDYKITRDPALVLKIEKLKSDRSATVFRPKDIRVGTDVEVEGDYDEITHELRAHAIKVFLFDTVEINRLALLEKPPLLEKGPSGKWHGVLFADGLRVDVSDATEVTVKPNKTEIEAAKAKGKVRPEQPYPLSSLDEVNLDTFVQYKGSPQPDGSVLASSVQFEHEEIEEGEARHFSSWAPRVKAPDYVRAKPGKLKEPGKSYKLSSDKEAQEYVSRLGSSLIPDHQKDLPAGNPLKIPFQFFLAINKSPEVNGYSTGTVIVNSGVFGALENEAQLAYFLSSEMASSFEHQWWRDMEYHKVKIRAVEAGQIILGFPGNFVLGSIANDYLTNDEFARSLANQRDRIALEWMLASGYDICQAPLAWKASSLKHVSRESPFWDIYDMRRSYLTAQLKIHYSDVDCSSLKKDSEEFKRVAQHMKEVGQKKK